MAAVCSALEQAADVLRRAPDHRTTVVGDEDRALDEHRVLGHDLDPAATVVREALEVEVLGHLLAHARELPRLHAQHLEHAVELGGTRRLVEVATLREAPACFLEDLLSAPRSEEHTSELQSLMPTQHD